MEPLRSQRTTAWSFKHLRISWFLNVYENWKSLTKLSGSPGKKNGILEIPEILYVLIGGEMPLGTDNIRKLPNPLKLIETSSLYTNEVRKAFGSLRGYNFSREGTFQAAPIRMSLHQSFYFSKSKVNCKLDFYSVCSCIVIYFVKIEIVVELLSLI